MNKKRWVREFLEGMDQNKQHQCMLDIEDARGIRKRFIARNSPEDGYWYARILSILGVV